MSRGTRGNRVVLSPQLESTTQEAVGEGPDRVLAADTTRTPVAAEQAKGRGGRPTGRKKNGANNSWCPKRKPAEQPPGTGASDGAAPAPPRSRLTSWFTRGIPHGLLNSVSEVVDVEKLRRLRSDDLKEMVSNFMRLTTVFASLSTDNNEASGAAYNSDP